MKILDEIEKQILRGRATHLDYARYQVSGELSVDLAKSIADDLSPDEKLELMGRGCTLLAKTLVAENRHRIRR